MLYLIGLGLWDEKDITVKGLEIARSCSRVYLEMYTSRLMGAETEKIEKLIGKNVHELSREDIEENPFFLDEALDEDIAVLVGGDPLVATTHVDLLIRAMEKGVEYKVIHNASIYSAVSETGLQIYRFGKTASIPFWEENFKPKSFYDVMKQNLKNDLHTLFLLDIKPPRYMSPKEAIEILSNIDNSFLERDVVVLSRVGGDTKIVYGRAGRVKDIEFGKPMHVLIVPASLHPVEEEFLEKFKYK